MTEEEKCTDCGKPKVEYVIRGGICENCWIDWWVEGMGLEGREKEAYRREVKADLRKKKKRKGRVTRDTQTERWIEKQRNKQG